MALEHWLRTYFLSRSISKGTERTIWKWHADFVTSNQTSGNVSSSKAIPPNPVTLHQVGTKQSTYETVGWESLSFKSSQKPSICDSYEYFRNNKLCSRVLNKKIYFHMFWYLKVRCPSTGTLWEATELYEVQC